MTAHDIAMITDGQGHPIGLRLNATIFSADKVAAALRALPALGADQQELLAVVCPPYDEKLVDHLRDVRAALRRPVRDEDHEFPDLGQPLLKLVEELRAGASVGLAFGHDAARALRETLDELQVALGVTGQVLNTQPLVARVEQLHSKLSQVQATLDVAQTEIRLAKAQLGAASRDDLDISTVAKIYARETQAELRQLREAARAAAGAIPSPLVALVRAAQAYTLRPNEATLAALEAAVPVALELLPREG